MSLEGEYSIFIYLDNSHDMKLPPYFSRKNILVKEYFVNEIFIVPNYTVMRNQIR
jgi:hypothetical protein